MCICYSRIIFRFFKFHICSLSMTGQHCPGWSACWTGWTISVGQI
jgi:hypothetical protein